MSIRTQKKSPVIKLTQQQLRERRIAKYKSKKEPVIHISPNSKVIIKPVSSYKVTSHIKRKWTELDAKYWIQFNIGTKLLNKYNVFPLKEYTFSKELDKKISEINIKNNYTYGYFKNDGTLYKIYHPYSSKKKFIKVKSYIQGTDQLEYKKPNLISQIAALQIISYSISVLPIISTLFLTTFI